MDSGSMYDEPDSGSQQEQTEQSHYLRRNERLAEAWDGIHRQRPALSAKVKKPVYGVVSVVPLCTSVLGAPRSSTPPSMPCTSPSMEG